MRFYEKHECETWLAGLERQKPDAQPGLLNLHLSYPREPYRVFYYASWIASHLTFRKPVLLWITEWGIWASIENWHLYYRLRQSYGDLRLLHEAPGHLFLEHESEDCASFLQLAMLNGWGGYVLTQRGDVDLFFSHDEFINFYTVDQSWLDEIHKALVVDGKPSP